jgi:hypothetical protein
VNWGCFAAHTRLERTRTQSLARDGSFAELCLLDASLVMHIHSALSDTAAAAVPCPALTAWQALAKVSEGATAPRVHLLCFATGSAAAERGPRHRQMGDAHGLNAKCENLDPILLQGMLSNS